ncbi:hypothetical protein BKA64DRAFT_639414 [Cadophora sp. MPI-SDFR-AT-0126]|nr:hypothetical protein BKA64DRAFT_639414 [Leotiomycetes sp. MPI-SDFR-AT-0126]
MQGTAMEGGQGQSEPDERTGDEDKDKHKHKFKDKKGSAIVANGAPTNKNLAKRIPKKEAILPYEALTNRFLSIRFPKNEVHDEYHRYGKRAPIDAKTHRHVKVVNLWKSVKALTVYNIMNRYSNDKRSPRVLGVDILKSEKENEVSAIVCFVDREDAFKVAELFSGETNWRWNHGFRARITDMTRFWVTRYRTNVVNINTELRFHLKYPELLGQRIDDVMDNIRPGCVVHLPAGKYFRPKTGACVDVRFNNEIRGHPVIIVKRHSNDFVNIVLCTAFGNRSIENVFRNRPEKIREYIEVDSTSGLRIRQAEMNHCEGPTSPRGLLTFEGDSKLPLKGYAGTIVYTTSLKSLARLQMECLKHVPGGYLKLYNLQLLLNRIKLAGDDPNAEYFTSDDPDSIRGKLTRRADGRGILAKAVRNDPRLASYL